MEGNTWDSLDTEILNACQLIWGSKVYEVQSQTEIKVKPNIGVEWITILLLSSYWSFLSSRKLSYLALSAWYSWITTRDWKTCLRNDNIKKSDLKPFEIWWHILIIPDVEKLGQENFCRFGVTLGYMTNSRWAWPTQRKCHKRINK